MADGSAIGMMEGAYFVGRGELLSWLNELLGLNYKKVEECASGAAYCQVVDACFPGTVPISKLNFKAKFEYEYLKNFKILQDTFNKLKVEKVVPVDRLVRGKYQDNLEMLQWIKAYYDINRSEEYDAAAVRERAQSRAKQAANRRREMVSQKAAASRASKPTPAGKAPAPAAPAARAPGVTRTKTEKAPARKGTTAAAAAPSATRAPARSSAAAGRSVSLEVHEKLKEQVAAMSLSHQFYFGKLLKIEDLLNEVEDGNTDKEWFFEGVKKVLFETADGFEISDQQ